MSFLFLHTRHPAPTGLGHADPRTLMIDNDNRNKDLWEMSELLTLMLENTAEQLERKDVCQNTSDFQSIL
ncbi:hypothetical protein [Nostoc sp. FACHB-145]|uniref:hypothetical protein n=1 Tax=Nostoc sp. FACHB-145 TaxID=2692836 RepID=UPI0016871DB8|nr:hypothetical protein [Nostoc sp. FACHB-145]MBD2472137.1 hypothetical protein [Nostoc sp. FACHB-145]